MCSSLGLDDKNPLLGGDLGVGSMVSIPGNVQILLPIPRDQNDHNLVLNFHQDESSKARFLVILKDG